ncbi:putative recQ mediated genome instability protein [Lyophyllum shimeji]|uniref:RecQ-mediated genome instability protein 1 n=1 Tax=Lyophyllum shimeji TaxID=47721 RepID=A0A9P3PPL8_LYOSH|nr:putative recQ mediated genome instability protein [Lyophyllum shimeji]
MAVPPRVVKWVDENYKKPRVDPEWLSQCYAWLTTEGGQDPDRDFEKLVKALEYQILESNFQDSMLPGTGLPTHIGLPTTSTTVKGVLVEVASMTEIAHSAFNLNQISMAREERLKSGDVKDEEGEGDIDVAGEGPIPKYPRGMLKFELTDGTTALRAMEYRPIPQLSLEKTPLGYKILLEDVRVNRGIAFLEPKSIALLGEYKTEDRDVHRQADFARGLRARMGLPEPPDTEHNAQPAPIPPNAPPHAPRPGSPVNVRSPLREISPPPSPPPMHHGHDDEDLGTRRRRVPNRNPEPSAATTITTSSYFANPAASGSASQSVVGTAPTEPASMLSLSPTLRNTMRPLYVDSPPPSPGPEDEHFWSDEAENQQRASLTEIKARNPAHAPSQNGQSQRREGAVANGKTKAIGGDGDITVSSDEFDDDNMFDSNMLAGLDAIDALNTNTSVAAPPTSTIGSSSLSGSSARHVKSATMDVITIEDDSDADDKENHPAPTRHVRRRTEDMSQASRSGSQRARDPNRPIVLAKTASAIINLSDSD